MTKTDMLPEERPFSAFRLTKALQAQIEKLGFTQATPIQWQAIPLAMEGKDVIGIAQTGTGKTLAFAIPAIQRLANGEGKALILLPTRELALQVEEEMAKVGRYFGMKTAVLIGGASMFHQEKQLRRDANVIIATPGRLNDFLEQRKVSLKDVCVLVLDEADRMLDMGFEPQIRTILAETPADRQTMLFSATMPEEIQGMVKRYMKDPVRVQAAPQGTTASKIEQEGYVVHKNDKMKLLYSFVQNGEGPVIVFSRTKHGAKKITKDLRDIGIGATEIHSNRSLNQRREALDGFKSGKYQVLIATDIAARGIDVNNIKLVVNFDLPDQSEDYVHRIGRTGRAGKDGKAISFIEPRQRREWKFIERLVRKTVPLKQANQLAEMPERGDVEPFKEPRRGFGGGHKREFQNDGPRRGGDRRESGRRDFGGRKRESRGGFFGKRDSREGAPERRERSFGGRSTGGRFGRKEEGRERFGEKRAERSAPRRSGKSDFNFFEQESPRKEGAGNKREGGFGARGKARRPFGRRSEGGAPAFAGGRRKEGRAGGRARKTKKRW